MPLYSILLYLSLCFSSYVSHAIIWVGDASDSAAFEELAAEPQFAPVGLVVCEDPDADVDTSHIISTGTLIQNRIKDQSGSLVLTAAHNIEGCSLDRDNPFFWIEGREYPVQNWSMDPQERFAALHLKDDVEGVDPAVLGGISNEDLSQKIYDQIPSLADLEKPMPRVFMTAGFGRHGVLGQRPQDFTRDFKKRAGFLDLKSRLSQQYDLPCFEAPLISAYGPPYFEGESAKHNRRIGGAVGDSGAPLLMRNYAGTSDRWHVVGVMESNMYLDDSFHVYGSRFYPFNKETTFLEHFGDTLRHIRKLRRHTNP